MLAATVGGAGGGVGGNEPGGRNRTWEEGCGCRLGRGEWGGLERSSSGTHLEPEPIDLDGMLYRKERLLRVTPRDSS